jgi:hypothetical protein
LSQEELNQVKILDKEGNPFFKVVEMVKKPKVSKILKRRKKVPFSEVQPRKKQRLDRFH